MVHRASWENRSAANNARRAGRSTRVGGLDHGGGPSTRAARPPRLRPGRSSPPPARPPSPAAPLGSLAPGPRAPAPRARRSWPPARQSRSQAFDLIHELRLGGARAGDDGLRSALEERVVRKPFLGSDEPALGLGKLALEPL